MKTSHICLHCFLIRLWAWTPAPLRAHPSIECSCTAPQIETHTCNRRTTTHQFFWQQRHTCGAVGGPSMERGVGGQPPQESALQFQTPVHTLSEWPSQEGPGSGSTASAPVSDVSAPACTNGVMASSAACECGAEQIVDHVVLHCPIHRPPHGLHGLTVLDDETTEWLFNTCPDI